MMHVAFGELAIHAKSITGSAPRSPRSSAASASAASAGVRTTVDMAGVVELGGTTFYNAAQCSGSQTMCCVPRGATRRSTTSLPAGAWVQRVGSFIEQISGAYANVVAFKSDASVRSNRKHSIVHLERNCEVGDRQVLGRRPSGEQGGLLATMGCKRVRCSESH